MSNFVKQLPPEILARIFTFLPDQWAILEASRVCSRWLSVVLSTAQLWTRLSFDIQQIALLDALFPGMITTFLRRSAGLPLALELTDPIDTEQEWKAVVSILSQCASRLQYLSLEGSARELPMPSLVFAELEVVRLVGDICINLELFQQVPRLRTLTLEDAGGRIDYLPDHLSHIHCLKLVNCFLGSVASIIGSYTPTSLDHKVQIVSCRSSWMGDDSYVTSAKSLKFIHGVVAPLWEDDSEEEDDSETSSTASKWDNERRLDFLSEHKAPELQELTIAGFRFPQFLQSAELWEFIQGCEKLRKLEIGTGPRGSSTDKADLTEFIHEYAPSLTSLAIHDGDASDHARLIHDEFIEALVVSEDTSDEEEEIFLPDLHSLELTISRAWIQKPAERRGDKLVDAIASRRRRSSPSETAVAACLRSLRLSVAPRANHNLDDSNISGGNSQELVPYTVEDALGKEAYARLLAMTKSGLRLITSLPPPNY